MKVKEIGVVHGCAPREKSRKSPPQPGLLSLMDLPFYTERHKCLRIGLVAAVSDRRRRSEIDATDYVVLYYKMSLPETGIQEKDVNL